MRSVTLHSIAASAAGEISEDAWGHVGDENFGAAWVLDGATGLGEKNYITAAYSDAAWYASELSRALAKFSLSDLSGRDVFLSAIQNVTQSWQTQSPHDTPRYALPSAAGVWLRWHSHQLEYISLGDCRAWHVSEYSDVRILGALGDDPNDAWLAARIAEHQANGISPADMRNTVMPILREARSRMNTPDGYDIFSIHESTAHNLIVHKTTLSPGHLILCSDGLFRWVDVLQQGNSAEFLAACTSDISRTLAAVRATEIQDFDCIQYTRLKQHDDATGIVLQIK
jgi:hypothetical protein